MESVLELLAQRQPRRLDVFVEPAIGLRAFLVIDSVAGGISAGGTRTRNYATAEAAVGDACELSRAMTLKCGIAGLEAGGAKMVVMDQPGLDRARAFEYLGGRVQELGGTFLTAGDLGTHANDLAHMATRTEYVRTDEPELGGAVGASVRVCAAAAARVRGHADLRGLRVAVQGCGAMGAAVAHALRAAGAELVVADLDVGIAERLAAEIDARVMDADDILTADADIVAPCATGGVIGEHNADAIQAWAVCGAANNILASAAAGERLASRDVLMVPDFVASAGAVVVGICDYTGRADGHEIIDRLGPTTEAILRDARTAERTPTDVATERALAAFADRA